MDFLLLPRRSSTTSRLAGVHWLTRWLTTLVSEDRVTLVSSPEQTEGAETLSAVA